MTKRDIKIGITHYVGGPCVHGNVEPRRMSDRKCTCTACVSAKVERSRERQRGHYARNRDMHLARNASWHADNPGRAREKRARRRARKLNATPSWFGELDVLVISEAFDLAARRERVTGFAWNVDHMIPLQAREASGLHVGANVQVIPKALNIRKHNRMVFTEPCDWLQAI